MTIEDALSSLRRRRGLFLLTLALALAVTVAVTYSLPETYRAKAVMLVETDEEQLDTASIEQLTRTFATLAANPNVVDAVRERMPGDESREEILDRMSFRPVERTQLLEIAADDRDPETAAMLANLYGETFAERVTADVESGASRGRIAVAEPAATPTEAVKPNPPLYIGLGAIVALGLAFGVALTRDRLDQRIPVDEEEDTALGLPLLARVPKLSGERNAAAFADAFRLLRANVDFARGQRAQLLLVTSPGSGEGKSTVALGLAQAAAEDGERVLVLEADLRRPALERAVPLHGPPHDGRRHGRLRRRSRAPGVLERNPLGLSDHLARGVELEELVDSHPLQDRLHVLWSGAVPPQPTRMLHSERLERLLAQLRTSYDRIVVDTPPVSVGADTKLLAREADGVVYVVDAESTAPAPARAALNQLRRLGAQTLGVVLNRAPAPPLPSYYDGRAPLATGAGRGVAREPGEPGTARRRDG